MTEALLQAVKAGLKMTQTIELDCAPGSIRPGDLIAGVLKDTGIAVRPDIGRSFGNWTWDYSDLDPVVWQNVRPVIKARITALHERGVIRYGSW